MKNIIRRALIDSYLYITRILERSLRRIQSVEHVFTNIYEKKLWGGSQGEFCSGIGTTNE